MAYDLTGFWNPDKPGPHSPYSFAEQSIAYWEQQGLSKEKMTLGLPFYGYDFTDLTKIPSVTFREMVERDNSFAYKDAVGKIHYNGIPTIENKTRLALEGLGGIMIWEIGQDHFGNYSLLDRIYKVIQ
jgi:GH18 family chitinase